MQNSEDTHIDGGMLKDKLILLVDDEPSLLTATRRGLAERGFNVQAAEGAQAAG